MAHTPNREKVYIALGKWTVDAIDRLLRNASMIKNHGKRIGLISEYLLGIPYRKNTLNSVEGSREVLVIDLSAMDCFTFIDYVEAMCLSTSFDDFRTILKRVRYRGGKVAYQTRNHFFTDWKWHNRSFVEDITGRISDKRAVTMIKRLNMKRDGTPFVQGIAPFYREMCYIPSRYRDQRVIDALKTGDYVGIYTEEDGLDCSHVGIVIKGRDGQTLFRHASSQVIYKRVIDEELAPYLALRPGLIVFRPK